MRSLLVSAALALSNDEGFATNLWAAQNGGSRGASLERLAGASTPLTLLLFILPSPPAPRLRSCQPELLP